MVEDIEGLIDVNADTTLISGLTWSVILPFITALVGLLIGWQIFLRRDLQNP